MAQTSLNSTGVASSGSLVLQTNGTTAAVTIDTSQNVGVGVTPSAWSVLTGLQVKNAGVWGAGADSGFVNNGYFNGSNWRYITTSGAALYQTSSNVHAWYNAASGTAGNAISFVQAMTLDASGNLGIGTTSPAANLDIVVSTGSAKIKVGNGTLSGGAYLNLQGTSASKTWFVSSNFNVGGALEFIQSTAAGGSTPSGTASMVLDSNGKLTISRTDGTGLQAIGVYNTTTASAANVVVLTDGVFQRSTSALKYKQDVRDLEEMDIGLLRPVRYKSKCEGDDQTKDHLGLIADEAADAGFEELVSRGAENEVEGFQYERLTVVLLKKLQTLDAEFKAYVATHP
jgi:hypothetical protein